MIYLIKVFICSGVLYGYYALAFKNDNTHHWNRYYLLLATLLSLVLPMIEIPYSGETAYATQLISLRETIISSDKAGNYIPSVSSLWLIFYSLIGTILTGRLLLNVLKIRKLARENPVDEQHGIILLQKASSPFSFFNSIFWPADLTTDSPEGQRILRHEQAHVTGHHTTDKMIMEIICAICWINPFFYLLKKELSMVHEFIADKAATDPDTATDYARTLLLLTLQSKQLPVVNSFTQAPVKRRILMLLNNKTNNTIMKRSIVLPLVTMLIAAISLQQKSIAQVQKPAKSSKEVLTFVDNPPEFKGGGDELAAYLSKNIKYPKAAQDKNITGTIFVQFIVESDGAIRDVKTVGKKLGGGLEEESIRVVQEMPQWKAGTNKGEAVAVMFNLPIRYTMDKNKKS